MNKIKTGIRYWKKKISWIFRLPLIGRYMQHLKRKYYFYIEDVFSFEYL